MTSQKDTGLSLRRCLRAAVIAAIYTALTLLIHPLSYGLIQVRFAEFLTVLPALMPEAVIGVTIGCLISNLFSGLWTDIVFGTLATFVAACLTCLIGHRLRRNLLLAALPPVILNALVIPLVIFAAITPGLADMGIIAAGFPAYLMGALFIAAGQTVAVYVIGVPFCLTLRRLPDKVLR